MCKIFGWEGAREQELKFVMLKAMEGLIGL